MTIPDRKRIYKEYILMKMFEEDFHAVSDAANDLRELEVEEKIRNQSAPTHWGSVTIPHSELAKPPMAGAFIKAGIEAANSQKEKK